MREDNRTIKRDTGRCIVIDGSRVLLIERWRPGEHFFSIPGGGIEPGETPEQAAVREVREETSVEVSLERELYVWHEGVTSHHVFLGKYIDGEPQLSINSEEAKAGKEDIYEPKWVELSELPSLTLTHWRPIYMQLIKDLKTGFSEKVVHLTD